MDPNTKFCRQCEQTSVDTDNGGITKIIGIPRRRNISHIYIYHFFSLNFHVSGKFQKTEFVRGNGSSLPCSLCWWMSSVNITRYSCCRLATSIRLLREWLDTTRGASKKKNSTCKSPVEVLNFHFRCINILLRSARLKTRLPQLHFKLGLNFTQFSSGQYLYVWAHLFACSCFARSQFDVTCYELISS